MDVSGILSRIESRIRAAKVAGVRISERSVSLDATGSTDTIRNWRRATREGRQTTATLAKVEAVAAALGVAPEWLLTGEGGLSEAPSQTVAEILEHLNALGEQELLMIRDAALGLRARRQSPES